MKVLVINSGSSSIKYQLLNMENENVLAKGLVERIGIDGSRIVHRVNGGKNIIEEDIPNHDSGLKMVLDLLVSSDQGVLESLEEIDAVGHRVVHGGERFASSVRINKEVLDTIELMSFLAPLHNPANIMGIRASMELLPNADQVAVFDTSFHQTMPKTSYLYAIPYEYYEKYKVRRYGFHGTSHRYVAKRTAELLGEKLEDLKIISCHIGNGASVAAVKNGKSIDTSMGFTPLEGLAMGTRSGDLDPAIIEFICKEEEITPKEMLNILNKKSGMLGVTKKYSDMRDIEDNAIEGEKVSRLAFDIYEYRIAKYIGAYAAAMNGVDAIVFTAGVGENSPIMREEIAEKYLGYLGVKIDKKVNDFKGEEKIISTEDSRVKLMVVPTNEELMIARDTKEIVANNLNELK
ncbi:acetate/propionate family kinase [Geotoga petraea]|uniref:Acetate kinase n=1 Tax=Geotoga petraea TaxID=28234 RepID=A0A4Z0W373_9BACT|nr:acetate kinase [Geotoga petraea]TGG88969.1 acetate kinase [Geotoga petraea]